MKGGDKMKTQAKEKYGHNINLTGEIELRLKAQRMKGRTIVGLLILGIQEAEKETK